MPHTVMSNGTKASTVMMLHIVQASGPGDIHTSIRRWATPRPCSPAGLKAQIKSQTSKPSSRAWIAARRVAQRHDLPAEMLAQPGKRQRPEPVGKSGRRGDRDDVAASRLLRDVAGEQRQGKSHAALEEIGPGRGSSVCRGSAADARSTDESPGPRHPAGRRRPPESGTARASTRDTRIKHSGSAGEFGRRPSAGAERRRRGASAR